MISMTKGIFNVCKFKGVVVHCRLNKLLKVLFRFSLDQHFLGKEISFASMAIIHNGMTKLRFFGFHDYGTVVDH